MKGLISFFRESNKISKTVREKTKKLVKDVKNEPIHEKRKVLARIFLAEVRIMVNRNNSLPQSYKQGYIAKVEEKVRGIFSDLDIE